MSGRTTVAALVPAAGGGTRLGAGPKAFVPLAGRTLLEWSIDGLLESGYVDRVVVAAPADLVDHARSLLPETIVVVSGGTERHDSVRNGMAAAGPADIVIVHDAARALTPPELIRRVVRAALDGADAVVPGLPVTDTVKTVDAAGIVTGTPPRADLRAIQTPQAFSAGLLAAAHASGAADATDDATLVERLGAAVHVVPGDPLAFKITTPLDLVLAQSLVERGLWKPSSAPA